MMSEEPVADPDFIARARLVRLARELAGYDSAHPDDLHLAWVLHRLGVLAEDACRERVRMVRVERRLPWGVIARKFGLRSDQAAQQRFRAR